VIAKVDADIVLGPAWFKELEQPTSCFRTAVESAFGQYVTRKGPSRGVFVIKKDHIKRSGGFNEYIKGWGWDDLDLYIRIYQAGICIQRMSPDDVWPIDHPHTQSYARHDAGLESRVFARKRANNALNREIGRLCPWRPETPGSEYEVEADGVYRLVRLPEKVKLSSEETREVVRATMNHYCGAMGLKWYYLNRIAPTLTRSLLRRELSGLFDNPLIDFAGWRGLH
jgi:hypothetical protein